MRFRLLFSILAAVLISCESSTDPIPEEIINDPMVATLIFPEDNTECNEGTIINDASSRVNFQWNASEFTDTYVVVLENLDTNTTSETESANNSKEIVIARATSYKWYVISQSDESTETAKSEEWQFYNAGDGTVNYAPFPADVVAPENGGETTPVAGKATLKWSASDIDNDIKEYEVFFGTANPPTSNLGIITDTEIEVDVVSTTDYFWMVKTTDEADNTSSSDVFSFTTN